MQIFQIHGCNPTGGISYGNSKQWTMASSSWLHGSHCHLQRGFQRPKVSWVGRKLDNVDRLWGQQRDRHRFQAHCAQDASWLFLLLRPFDAAHCKRNPSLWRFGLSQLWHIQVSSEINFGISDHGSKNDWYSTRFLGNLPIFPSLKLNAFFDVRKTKPGHSFLMSKTVIWQLTQCMFQSWTASKHWNHCTRFVRARMRLFYFLNNKNKDNKSHNMHEN